MQMTEYNNVWKELMVLSNIQKISCKSMQKDAEELEMVLKNLPQTIEQLQVSMRKLSSCWNGPAWENFQFQVNKDIQNISVLYKDLTELQKSLSESRNIYLQTEFNIYKDIKSIWI